MAGRASWASRLSGHLKDGPVRGVSIHRAHLLVEYLYPCQGVGRGDSVVSVCVPGRVIEEPKLSVHISSPWLSSYLSGQTSISPLFSPLILYPLSSSPC